ncbi:uncharacterized protein ACA1_180790 [Acanthamoeba castellanii str. Neff]|uniref:Uncharacterized protein n=1 Tax=Acanthamoeba castellanii (strain ATCC 30010 / Neff) TaxID=1257118 RepID=L8GCQ0_ACACF|nr:uncharacterized protein ACA1_180790 [Acanthamoeba castellanii str. Neff]ELR10857.1 hypothetical protein ACA1_180790 [Acanthamoeba castellanii str. Neff]
MESRRPDLLAPLLRLPRPVVLALAFAGGRLSVLAAVAAEAEPALLAVPRRLVVFFASTRRTPKGFKCTQPTVVIVVSLVFIGVVIFMHLWGRFFLRG